jgi:hypothetical protein
MSDLIDQPDEHEDLPEIVRYMGKLPAVLTQWWAHNLQRLVNNPQLDGYEVQRSMTHMQAVTDLIEEWARKSTIHKQDADLKAMRYWWSLFMHLHGPREL